MVQSHSGKKIILASGSPRRRDLLGGLGIEFTVDTGTTFVESSEPGVDAYQVPVDMAEGKSHGFHRPLEADEILITADTVVIVGGEVLGKPVDREDAFRMLRALSGREHDVVTAVVIRSAEKEVSFAVTTAVTFDKLSEEDITYYVDNFKPFDKAGAYGIQEWIGYAGISRIEGSFYNVVGFPVQRVWTELKAFM